MQVKNTISIEGMEKPIIQKLYKTTKKYKNPEYTKRYSKTKMIETKDLLKKKILATSSVRNKGSKSGVNISNHGFS